MCVYLTRANQPGGCYSSSQAFWARFNTSQQRKLFKRAQFDWEQPDKIGKFSVKLGKILIGADTSAIIPKKKEKYRKTDFRSQISCRVPPIDKISVKFRWYFPTFRTLVICMFPKKIVFFFFFFPANGLLLLNSHCNCYNISLCCFLSKKKKLL